MKDELRDIDQLLFTATTTHLTELHEDPEAKEYCGYNFQIQNRKFKYRKAKLTPKKVGFFVTLWRRNQNQQTEPFHESDDFDFYIIHTQDHDRSGYFIFPKSELIRQNILSTDSKEGKRGFRVYPPWSSTQNKQAQKTQSWQTHFFIHSTNEPLQDTAKLNEILNSKQA